MTSCETEEREFLRHALATLAYRGGKALRDAPAGFSGFRVEPQSRTPGEILAHVCDLFDWANRLLEGEQVWKESQPQEWEADVRRLFEGLRRVDEYLASGRPLGFPARQLFQGPVADALTHVGQIAMLRRIAGSPVRGENYFKADIVVGRIGPSQSPARREFD